MPTWWRVVFYRIKEGERSVSGEERVQANGEYHARRLARDLRRPNEWALSHAVEEEVEEPIHQLELPGVPPCPKDAASKDPTT